MGELVYRKELWTIKDRSEWQRSYGDLVEAAYKKASESGASVYGSRPNSGMYAGSAAGIGYTSGYRTGSRRIGSGAFLSGSMRTGSFSYSGSGTSKGNGSNVNGGGIMSLGYGMHLI